MGRFPTPSEQEWNEYLKTRDAEHDFSITTATEEELRLLFGDGWTVTKPETPR